MREKSCEDVYQEGGRLREFDYRISGDDVIREDEIHLVRSRKKGGYLL